MFAFLHGAMTRSSPESIVQSDVKVIPLSNFALHSATVQVKIFFVNMFVPSQV